MVQHAILVYLSYRHRIRIFTNWEQTNKIHYISSMGQVLTTMVSKSKITWCSSKRHIHSCRYNSLRNYQKVWKKDPNRMWTMILSQLFSEDIPSSPYLRTSWNFILGLSSKLIIESYSSKKIVLMIQLKMHSYVKFLWSLTHQDFTIFMSIKALQKIRSNSKENLVKWENSQMSVNVVSIKIKCM